MIKKIGASFKIIFIIMAQLVFSLIIDHFGFLGDPAINLI